VATPNITRIGKYEIIETLGRGGMGVVYRAFDRQLRREVAIKTITERLIADPEMLSRFYREASKTAALKHPNIVIVYDLGEQDGFPYIVMEYLSGEPLDKLIRSQRPVSLAFKLKVIEEVCSALGYAHQNDVIHRDVKPGNVIVQPDGVTKLLDFGIARQERLDDPLTSTGDVIGTLQYIAPERLKSEFFDGRSDIFSVGVLLFQVLTGQLPFAGDDYAIRQKILNEKHPQLTNYLLNYPPVLDQILDRALAKGPRDRYATAEEMAADVASAADEARNEQVQELFQQGEQLVQEERFTEAREVLLRLLKLDYQNSRARQLMIAVQQNLSQRKRAEQLRKLRALADNALTDRLYDEAIAHLGEALKLDPSSSELADSLRSVQNKKRIHEQVNAYLREAESARDAGDLRKARSVIAKALEIDREDSRVLAAARRIEELTLQGKAKQLLQSALVEIDARHFTKAIELLKEAEQIDPSNPELILLLNAAKSGREDQQRRRVLDQLQNEAALAGNREQVVKVLKSVEEALVRMPVEPMLLKLKVQLSGQLRELETRNHVDMVVQRCRALLDTSPPEALKVVKEELQRAPGDERLVSLRTTIEAQLSRWTLEQARARYMKRASDALNRKQYKEAIALLQTCQAEGLFSHQLSELLELAQHEAKQQELQQEKELVLARAQELTKQGAHDSVVDLLSPLSGERDPSLQALLDKARNQRDLLPGRIDSVLAQLTQLADQEWWEEALRFLQAQPTTILESAPVKAALSRLYGPYECDRVALESIGAGYAALDHADIESARSWIRRVVEQPAISSSWKQMYSILEDRCRFIADDRITNAMQESKAALRQDPSRATKMLRQVTPLLSYATPQMRAKWRSSRRKILLARMLRCIGIKMG
jgi:eukaryotic-like serine/threonine-protein kinase